MTQKSETGWEEYDYELCIPDTGGKKIMGILTDEDALERAFDLAESNQSVEVRRLKGGKLEVIAIIHSKSDIVKKVCDKLESNHRSRHRKAFERVEYIVDGERTDFRTAVEAVAKNQSRSWCRKSLGGLKDKFDHLIDDAIFFGEARIDCDGTVVEAYGAKSRKHQRKDELSKKKGTDDPNL